jgi:hypothetical protein
MRQNNPVFPSTHPSLDTSEVETDSPEVDAEFRRREHMQRVRKKYQQLIMVGVSQKVEGAIPQSE